MQRSLFKISLNCIKKLYKKRNPIKKQKKKNTKNFENETILSKSRPFKYSGEKILSYDGLQIEKNYNNRINRVKNLKKNAYFILNRYCGYNHKYRSIDMAYIYSQVIVLLITLNLFCVIFLPSTYIRYALHVHAFHLAMEYGFHVQCNAIKFMFDFSFFI